MHDASSVLENKPPRRNRLFKQPRIPPIFTQVKDKQALRLSSGSSHVETQNFASDVVICIHFFMHCPSEMQNFASLHVADSRPEACISCRTNENPYPELAYKYAVAPLLRQGWKYAAAGAFGLCRKVAQPFPFLNIGHFALQNDPFRSAKRPILEAKMALVATC